MNNPNKVIASISKAHYRTILKASGHRLFADEPEDLGGTASGPSPSEFLAASLASCTAITLRMYADRKGWDMAQADIQVSVLRDRALNITKITRKITLSGTLSEDQRDRLLVIANKCPVHQILSNQIQIESTLLLQ